MEFNEFRDTMIQHMDEMFTTSKNLFETDIDKDELWNLYLDSFPPGTNEIYRERREFDCSCCKQFIRNFGNIVIIDDHNRLVSVWDFDINDKKYNPVIKALSEYVKSKPITDIFFTHERQFGARKTLEHLDPGVKAWDHFYVRVPSSSITAKSISVGSKKGEYRDNKNVLKRSLEEITQDSIETVLELISQKSLYKGSEWKGQLEKFLFLKKEYSKLPHWALDNYCWTKSIKVGAVLAKIKNHSIGMLLSDISKRMDLDVAVTRYEKIVAPTNYKRPKAIFTKKMLQDAKDTLDNLGFLESLKRRHARIDDITVNNILFANKDVHHQIDPDDIFAEMEKEAKINPKKFTKVEEVSIDTFINDILPTTTSVELLFENRHKSNLMSLIAPENKNAKNIFKWDNNFSWAYNGNITDSMKERVKAAGGKVDGILRFSIQWNTENDNPNDYDARCIEPRGNHIYYMRPTNTRTKGRLDVDIRHPNGVAVENITWPNLKDMDSGEYQFYVNNYAHRGGRSGFSAEIEFDGEIYSFDYPHNLKEDENVMVAKILLNKKEGTIKFLSSLDSEITQTTYWNITTNQFHPVSIIMNSPNYWDDQKGVGHKHFFFIINECINETSPNGFFNEFLNEDLMKHKRVFEALGSKMKVDDTVKQLSGLGFSETKRNSVICKVTGAFTRTIKINF